MKYLLLLPLCYALPLLLLPTLMLVGVDVYMLNFDKRTVALLEAVDQGV